MFDLEMMGKWRERSPSTENMTRIIAHWLGAYKPQKPEPVMLAVSGQDRPPDPSADIRAAFRRAKFSEEGLPSV